MRAGPRVGVPSTLDGEHHVNTRFLRYALTACALSLPTFLAAQAAPRKPAGQGTSVRPAATPARPSGAPASTAATVAEAVSEPTPPAKPAPVPPPESPASPRAAQKPAAAAPQGEHVRVGLEAGLAAPMSSLGKAFSAGFSAGGFLTGRPEGFPVNLRGDLQYTRFAGKNKIVTPSYSVIQLTGAGVYDFPKAGGGKSPFFASAGLGLYRWSANGESQTDFGQNLGLGFNFRKYRFKPFVEGRFHFFNDVQYFTLAAAAHL